MEEHQKRDAYRIEAVLTGVQRKCFELCVAAPPQLTPNPAEHLTDGEAKCLDKCNWKYLETHKILNSQLTRMGKK